MESYFEYFQKFGVKPEVVFSTTAALVIFVLGFVLNRFNDWRIERRRIKTIRSFAFEYLVSMVEPIKKHSTFLSLLAIELRSVDISEMAYKDDGVRSSYLQGMPQLDLFRSLVYGFGRRKTQRIQDFNSILTILDHIERSRPFWLYHFKAMADNHNRFLIEWNQAVDPMVRNYERWRSELERSGLTPADNEFVFGLDRIIGTWQRIEDGRIISRMRQTLVQPIHDFAVRFSSDQRSLELIGLTTRAFSADNNRKKILSTGSSFYNDEAVKLEERHSTLVQILSRYKIPIKSMDNDKLNLNHAK